jgi:hypothetical protein
MERITRSNAVETASQGRSLAMKQEDYYTDDYFASAITVKLPEMNFLVDSFQPAYNFLSLGLQFLAQVFLNYVSVILNKIAQVLINSVISVSTC